VYLIGIFYDMQLATFTHSSATDLLLPTPQIVMHRVMTDLNRGFSTDNFCMQQAYAARYVYPTQYLSRSYTRPTVAVRREGWSSFNV
jgi:hypothetical protein